MQLANFARALASLVTSLPGNALIILGAGEGLRGRVLQNLSPARGYGDVNVAATPAAGIRGAQGRARCTLHAVWIIKASQVKSNYRGAWSNDKFPPLVLAISSVVYRSDTMQPKHPLSGEFTLSRSSRLINLSS